VRLRDGGFDLISTTSLARRATFSKGASLHYLEESPVNDSCVAVGAKIAALRERGGVLLVCHDALWEAPATLPTKAQTLTTCRTKRWLLSS
jgi:hypothetical protein